MEGNGFIFMWYHAEGAEPYWTPPVVDEISQGEWTYRGRTEHIVNCHIEEIPENGADVAHLGQVHGPIMPAGIDLRYMYSKIWSFGKHLWAAEWCQNTSPGEAHVGTLKLTHSIKLFGFKLPILDMDVTARQTGPGLVILTFDMWLFGKGTFVHVVTPKEPLTQRMVHHIYSNRYMPTLVAKFLMRSEALMVERDIMVWNNKMYQGKPVYVKSKEDSLIIKHRRWYSQFYSENSPRIKFTKDTLDW